MSLSAKQKQFLKGLAHSLKPVVQVGNKGVGDALIRQIDDQLGAHELIKVRWNTECEGEPNGDAAAIEKGAHCEVVQHAGRILVLYRRHDKKPKINLPSAVKSKS